jgi:acyl-CoA synthetase (AMP-forming)/AMP-acid ligase II
LQPELRRLYFTNSIERCVGAPVRPAHSKPPVIGIPDDRWGEQAIALLVLRAEADATAAEILAHVRGELADFKVPRRIEFVESLPRTPSGKIQKHLLREPYWQGRARRVN